VEPGGKAGASDRGQNSSPTGKNIGWTEHPRVSGAERLCFAGTAVLLQIHGSGGGRQRVSEEKKIGTGPNSTRPGVTGGRCPGQYWDPGLAGYGLWRNELAPCTLETLGLFGTMPNGWSREWVYSGDAEEYRLAGVEDSNC
jgi:hypothetical protein